MDPHIGHVRSGHSVAKPLMPALVDDDEVEPRADSDACPVALAVAVLIVIAIGDRALVLHARIRHLDQFVTVLDKRILAEVVVVRLHHRLGLRELRLRFVQVFRQNVVVHRQLPEPVAEVHIVADVQGDVVAVDWIMHLPVPACVAVAEILLAHEPPVRNIHQPVRHRDAYPHALHLIAPLVLIRPPHACADLFAGRVYPRATRRILFERHPAEPSLLDWISGVEEADRIGVPLAQLGREVDEDRARVPRILQLRLP